MIKTKKCEHLTFPINEGFDVQKCIRELNEISQTNNECVIHINFTLPFIKVCLFYMLNVHCSLAVVIHVLNTKTCNCVLKQRCA